MEDKDRRELLILSWIRRDGDQLARWPDMMKKHVYHSEGVASGLAWVGGIDEYQLLNIRNIADAYMNGGRA